MSFYIKANEFLIIIFICFFCKSIYATEAYNISLTKEINTLLNKNRYEYNLPAISLSIKLPYNNIQDYVSGYTVLQNKHITPETLFQIGSITKTFTATIIFKLIEENKLSGNDKLTKWLLQYPRWKNISIYDLLHHTSGIYNYTSGKSFDVLLRDNPQKYWSLKELTDLAYTHSDFFKPGKKYNYTNTDYILLGMVIEKVTHRSIQQIFDDYLRQYNLNDTFYSPSKYPDAVKNRIAHGYNQDGTFNFNKDVTFVNMSYHQSAGSMISTPHDLVKWLNHLFTGKIITRKSLEDMTQIISQDNANVININKINIPKNLTKSKPFIELGIGSGIGLMYFKNHGFTWVHAGGTPGYESFYAYNPCTGIYLVLAYNVKPNKQHIFLKIADEIFRVLHNSPNIMKTIKIYQKNNKLPNYCNYVN